MAGAGPREHTVPPMRMVHYFLVGVLLLVPSLGAALYTGWNHDGSERHLWVGLFAATLAIGVHTLLILFMVITGRVLREAMRSRPLGPEFLAELNAFFERKSAYPLAVGAAFAVVAAGVLGFSQRGFGISPAWHMLLGALAVFGNLWALIEEVRALRVNQRLIDRVASTLDAMDREKLEQGEELPADEPVEPSAIARWGLVVAVSSWLPYLYWVFINWRGDFSRVSLHPWIEASAAGLFVWWLASREVRARSVEAVEPGAGPDRPGHETGGSK